LKIYIPLGLLNCVALLVAGFGLVTIKPWARVLSIAYAIYAIIFCIATLLVNLTLMVQPFFQQVGNKQELEAAIALGGPLSGTLGGIFWVVYPIALLAFLLNPKVAAALRLPPPPQT